jgi:hypothetical protein
MQVPPGCNPNGLDMIHGPKAKNGGAASRQILYVQLFQRSLFIPNEFGHGPVPLERIPPYLSNESQNAPIGCRIRAEHQF